MQEVFLKVIDKIEIFDHQKGDFSAWIWQIARNHLIDYWRKEKKSSVSYIDDFQEKILVSNDWEVKLGMLDISRELSKMNGKEKTIFCLFYLSELSYQEISEITGKSEGSLRVVIHRTTHKLRNKIKC